MTSQKMNHTIQHQKLKTLHIPIPQIFILSQNPCCHTFPSLVNPSPPGINSRLPPTSSIPRHGRKIRESTSQPHALLLLLLSLHFPPWSHPFQPLTHCFWTYIIHRKSYQPQSGQILFMDHAEHTNSTIQVNGPWAFCPTDRLQPPIVN